MYVVSKVVLSQISPLDLLWLRYVVAIVCMLLVHLWQKKSWRVQKRELGFILLIGIIGYVVSIYCQFLGTQLSSAQLGSVITAATPTFMVLFARPILGERITIRKVISLLLATTGVFLIVGGTFWQPTYFAGGLVLLAAAISWALMSVLVKKLPKEGSSLLQTAYAMAVAWLLITPLVGQNTHFLLRMIHQPALLASVLYLGLVATAGAFFLWNLGLKQIDAGQGGLYFFFQPVVGTLLGWIFLQETVTLSFLFGALLVLGGLFVTTMRRDVRQTPSGNRG